VYIGGGKQGFQNPVAQDSFIVDGIGALGSKQSERGLTYIEVNLAGHMYAMITRFVSPCSVLIISIDNLTQGT
jgi:hypothetical protein